MKLKVIISLLMILCLLCACATSVPSDPTSPVQTDPTQASGTDPAKTDPTEPAQTDPTEPTETNPTEPTQPDPTEPTQTTPMDPALVAVLEELNAVFGARGTLYHSALTSIYASPDQLNLRTFLDGVQREHFVTLTQEERDQLSLPEGDVYRYSADEVEAYLNTYFGIGIQDLQDVALANLTYQESTDSYYYATSGCDGEVPMFHAYHLEALPDGTLLMYYTTGGWPGPNMVAKLQPTEDGYLILSNQPV